MYQPEEHLIAALHEAIREDRIFPVLFASGLGNIGTDHILDFLVTYAPTASESAPIRLVPASTAGNGASANGAASSETLTVSDSGPLALYVFKTISDPFAGHISFFKVFSGVVKNDATVHNFTRNVAEKFSHLSVMLGKRSWWLIGRPSRWNKLPAAM